MTKFDFDIDAVGAHALIDGVAERAVNMAPAFAIIAKLLESGRARIFESEGEYIGAPWPGLAESTQERKSRMGLPSEEMVETGALKSAVEGGAGAVTRITPTTIRVGVLGDFFYARFNMDRRPIVGINEADRAASVAIVQHYLEHGPTV